MVQPERHKCPHYDQVRLVAFHDLSARGPMVARSMTRKILGNEEFCMQVDAHTDFAKNWDEILKEEWKYTANEFGIISSNPAAKADKSDLAPGGSKANQVPRQCKIIFRENGFPVSVGSRLSTGNARCCHSSIYKTNCPNRITHSRTMPRPSISKNLFFPMAGRRPSPLPNVTLRRVPPTIRLRHTQCRLNSFLAMPDSGLAGT
jgi:Glycosyltransferase (GlcNAc)